MSRITAEQISDVVVEGQLAQEIYPVSKASASRLGRLIVEKLLLQGARFADVVNMRMTRQGFDTLISEILKRHEAAVAFWSTRIRNIRIRTTKDQLRQFVPGQVVGMGATAAYACAALINNVPAQEISLLRPGDPLFDETDKVVRSPEALQRLLEAMWAADHATTTSSRSRRVSYGYRGALLARRHPENILERYQPGIFAVFSEAEIAGGGHVLRARLSQGTGSILYEDLLQPALAGINGGEAAARTLVADPDAQIIRMLSGQEEVNVVK